VLTSALTALLSFGSLSLTSMPALQSFGMTLAVGIALSALLSPMVSSMESRES
jgi:predicted exporter